MKVAFVGKGGAGKSAIAGTFARLLGQRGDPVLAIDSDPMPGLAFSLGVESTDAGIPDEAVEEKPEGEEGPRYRLRAGLSAEQAIEEYAARAPDGVRMLQFGKLRGHVNALIRSQFAFRQIVDELPDGRWNLVGDLPGGTRQPYFGWGDYADTFLVVVEPTSKSVLAGRRLRNITKRDEGPKKLVAVVNRVRDDGDVARVEAKLGIEVVGAVPWDEELAEAERRGQAPVDSAPDSPAVRAIALLVDRLSEGNAS